MYLNSVYKMKTDNYSAQETAQMLLKILSDSLGLCIPELRRKCLHGVYDGVFASSEERDGGGGLSLCKHLEELLGCPEGTITGNYDMSHNLQIVYHKAIHYDNQKKTGSKFL